MIATIGETENYLIINKPAGLVVHTDGKTDEATVVDWIREHHPEIIGVGEPMTLQNGEIIDRPGIVHRLDRDTSGCMLIARNQPAFEYFKQQFQDRLVNKTYLAYVYEWPKEDAGTIEAEIGKSRKDFRQWSAQRGARGHMREAVTEFQVKERFTFRGGRYSLIEFYPKTGRTHQIRVHAKYMHHPIVADPIYAGKRNQTKKNLTFRRQALHAWHLQFVDQAGNEQTFTAPLPEDFTRAADLPVEPDQR